MCESTACRLVVVLAAICLAAAAGLALLSGFNCDDFLQMTEIQRPFWRAVGSYLSSADQFSAPFFRPGAHIAFRVLGFPFGLNPVLYHAFNLLLYGLTCFLLFRLVIGFKISRTVASWCTLLFALHPMHAEPVISITSMGLLIMGVLYLGGLLFYQRYLCEGDRRHALLTVVCFALALNFKEEALTFPIACFLMWRWFGSSGWKTARPLIWLVPAVVGWMGWRAVAGAGVAPGDLMLSFNPLTWVRNTLFYLVQFAIPVRTVFALADFDQYAHWRNMLPPTPNTLLYVLAVLAGAGTVLVVLVRRWRAWPAAVRLGLFFTAVTLLPFLPYTHSSNRFLYLPLAGLSLTLVAWVFESPRNRLWTWVFLIWIMIMSVALVEQASTWYEAGRLTERVLDDAERVRREIPHGRATIFRDVPMRHVGVWVFSSGFREALMLRTNNEFSEIYNFDRPGRDTRAIPSDAHWFRWTGDRFEPTRPPDS